MREFRERSYLRRIFFSRPVFLLLFFAVVLVGVSVFKAYKKSQVAVLKNEEVQNDINDLTDKKQSLESEISRLNNPAGVEKELREKFQLKKPGEDFVVIVDENSPEASATPADSRESFLEKAWNFVKNIF